MLKVVTGTVIIQDKLGSLMRRSSLGYAAAIMSSEMTDPKSATSPLRKSVGEKEGSCFGIATGTPEGCSSGPTLFSMSKASKRSANEHYLESARETRGTKGTYHEGIEQIRISGG
jgi:hypothetical protein